MKNKITSINARNVTYLRDQIDAAIKKVGEEHGLLLSIGSIRYTATSFKTTLTVCVADADDAQVTENAKFKADFINSAAMFGFKQSDFGREFEDAHGVRYKIVGLKPRSRNALLAERISDGKLWKINPDTAKRYFAKAVV